MSARATRRIAAAPISWGVCEVPGWGAVLPPSRVLAGMRSLGLTATELGPPGWLPEDPQTLRTDLAEAGMSLVGGFLALPLHHRTTEVMAVAARSTRLLAGAGAELMVLAAATGVDGYETFPGDTSPGHDEHRWAALVAGAEAVAELAAEEGLDTVLHPHVGTLVETPAQIDRFVADSHVGLCLDTGHVLVGGGDPVDVARRHAARVRHVHLKDVDAAVAGRVRSGELSYATAVATGLYRPLGAGGVDVAAVLAALDAVGYDGWFVLEQDTSLVRADEVSAVMAEDDVRACLRTLTELSPASPQTQLVPAKEPR